MKYTGWNYGVEQEMYKTLIWSGIISFQDRSSIWNLLDINVELNTEFTRLKYRAEYGIDWMELWCGISSFHLLGGNVKRSMECTGLEYGVKYGIYWSGIWN